MNTEHRQPLSPEQEKRLRSILSGEVELDDERLETTASDARSLQARMATTREQIAKAKALAAACGIELVRDEGAFDKCIHDLKRWDPVLSDKANGADEEPPEPPAAPDPPAAEAN